jgi:hypothetical protein
MPAKIKPAHFETADGVWKRLLNDALKCAVWLLEILRKQ